MNELVNEFDIHLDRAIETAHKEIGTPYERLSEYQTAILFLICATSSRTNARKLARVWGCGGGSAELDYALGQSFLPNQQAVKNEMVRIAKIANVFPNAQHCRGLK